ncbi:uncharacterized protein GGS22DRAFT_192230 [Annulohypoxylon maeteangense]|uniref:uncharacterized protein n=1 Tax=Annulohypoxylon maeteangense TaxID=1927788 RepID=UPI0020084104|nr:uncharacterized protein GGS22DRAFT_192230 [Annulohypoxylon maeteangense]KAI0881594.1 hypothetical protein GGS22DRAFT_192230 [Annulohypoxylon maeteangense]
MDEKFVAECLTNLFSVARQLVGRCQKVQPHEFWGEVGSHLVWARELSGSDLLDFSNRILSARNAFRSKVQFYGESRMPVEEIPERYRTWADSPLLQAMQEWTHSLHETYGPFSEERQLYYPQWLVDSDNEGTAEATQERFEERLEEMRRIRQQRSELKDNEGQETEAGVANTDGQDVEMEVSEGYNDPDDEDDYQDDYEGDYDDGYDDEDDEEGYYDEGDYYDEEGYYDEDDDEDDEEDYEKDDEQEETEHKDIEMSDAQDSSQAGISAEHKDIKMSDAQNDAQAIVSTKVSAELPLRPH